MNQNNAKCEQNKGNSKRNAKLQMRFTSSARNKIKKKRMHNVVHGESKKEKNGTAFMISIRSQYVRIENKQANMENYNERLQCKDWKRGVQPKCSSKRNYT